MVIEGHVVGELQGMRGSVTYRVRCRPDGTTDWVHGRVQRNGAEMSWTIRREESGLWVFNGVPVSGLAKCLDVDLGVTPSTNTLPIRRLAIEVGASEDCSAAWVRFPDLTVHPLAQRYTRLSWNSYRYESLESGFHAVLRVDEHGIIRAYTGLWSVLSD